MIKVIIIGDSQTGKTSLLLRHTNGEFVSDVTSTIGIDYRSSSYIYNDRHYMMQIWDTAGQERFHDIVRGYYRNVHAAIIVFDLSNRKTFESIPKWHGQLHENVTAGSALAPIVILVGNKSDIQTPDRPSLPEIRETVSRLGITSYVQCSAKDGSMVEDIFIQLRSRLEHAVQPYEGSPYLLPEVVRVEGVRRELGARADSNGKCCT